MAVFKVAAPPGFAHIYALECLGRYKVGWALNAADRLRTQQAGNPFRLRLVEAHLVPRDKARLVEAAIHRRLAEHRIEREWFRAGWPEVSAAIRVELAAIRYEPCREVGLTEAELDADDGDKSAFEIAMPRMRFYRRMG